MARRLTIAALIVLGGLALLVIGAIAFRKPILEAALERALIVRGVPEPHIRVTALTLGEIRLADLSLGEDAELRAEALVVHYDPREVIGGRVRAVEIVGPALRLDLTGSAVPLGSLQPLLAPGSGGAGPTVPLPLVQVTRGEIAAVTPIGPLRAKLDGNIAPAGDGIAATLAFEAESPQATAAGTLALAVAGSALSGRLDLTGGGARLPGASLHGLTGQLAFSLADGRPRRIEGRLGLATLDAGGADFEDASLTLDVDSTRAATRLTLRSRDRGLAVALDASLEDYPGTPRLALDLDATLDIGAEIWRRLPLPAPNAGRGRLRLQATGDLPPLGQLADAGLADLEAVSQEVTGQLEASLEDVAYAGRFQGLAAQVALDGSWRDGVLTLRPTGDNRIAIAALEPAWLAALGVPKDLAPVLTSGLSLALVEGAGPAPSARLERGVEGLQVRGRLPLELDSTAGVRARLDANGSAIFDQALGIVTWRLDQVALDLADLALPQGRARRVRLDGRLSGGAEHLAGQVEVSLALDGVTYGPVQEAAAALDALPIRIWSEPGHVSFQLARPGRVRLLALALADRLRLTGPAEIALQEAEFRLDGAAGADAALLPAASLVAATGGLAVTLSGVTAEPLPATLDIGQLRLGLQGRDASLKLADSRLALPSLGLALEGLSAAARQQGGPDRLTAEVNVAALRQTGAQPLATPVSLSGTVRRNRDQLDVEVEAQAAEGVARADLSARHDFASGRGRAEVRLEPLAFEPGGLQPAALAPPLAALKAVRGRVEAAGNAVWSADGLTESGARVQLFDVAFQAEGASVRGLALDLSLDRLWPPASPPDQSLRIALLDSGVALRDLSARFQLLPGAPPRLALTDFGTGLSGGRIGLRNVTLDPAAQRHSLPLRIEGLDLAELFGLLAIEGLSGSGRVTGTLPILLQGNDIAVEGGSLEAEAPGILRLRSAQAAQIFAGAGAEGRLLIEALADFHYERLSLTLDKPFEGDAVLALHLAGNNPAVREGQPFSINVSLTGNTGRVLTALREAYALSDNILRRAWMFGRSSP